MAHLNLWLFAAIAMLPALAIPAAACTGRTMARFISVQLVAALSILILVLLTFAFDQSASIDLPLCAALLNLPGSLVIALVLERWL